MKSVVVFLAACATIDAISTLLYEEEWQQFKTAHNISYRNKSDELERRQIFQENLQKIREHNLLYEHGLRSHKLGVTRFADLTTEEFKEMLKLRRGLRQKRTGRSLFQVPANKTSIPKSIDWRLKGAVTEVKEQGFCGSCWAFSVTGSLEGQYFLKHGQLVSFSEQQLVDCATGSYDSEGCNGGQLDSGFQYVRDQGIETEASYPYEMADDDCQANSTLVVTKIQDYVDVESNDEDALLAAVGLIGPVSVAFDASEFDMRFYKEGIYESKSCSQTELNHGVLVVGYGSEDGVDYWIVKNSWGINFGVKGYMYMRRGINQCGIALEPSYPVL